VDFSEALKKDSLETASLFCISATPIRKFHAIVLLKISSHFQSKTDSKSLAEIKRNLLVYLKII